MVVAFGTLHVGEVETLAELHTFHRRYGEHRSGERYVQRIEPYASETCWQPYYGTSYDTSDTVAFLGGVHYSIVHQTVERIVDGTGLVVSGTADAVEVVLRFIFDAMDLLGVCGYAYAFRFEALLGHSSHGNERSGHPSRELGPSGDIEILELHQCGIIGMSGSGRDVESRIGRGVPVGVHYLQQHIA